MIVEFTGCSGSGKTSLARRVHRLLRASGVPTLLSRGVCPPPHSRTYPQNCSAGRGCLWPAAVTRFATALCDARYVKFPCRAANACGCHAAGIASWR